MSVVRPFALLFLACVSVLAAARAPYRDLDAGAVVHLALAPSALAGGHAGARPRVIRDGTRPGDDRRNDFPASVTMTILPDLTPPTPAERRDAAAASRLAGRLTPEMRANFDLFLYVSKADGGPLAQRMYVFSKQPDDGLKLTYDWPASTGREQAETNAQGRRVLTATPKGFYELDPQRMYRRYHSASWDQDMASTMFFDWERAGRQTGLAIHAASGEDIARLGSRASAGCVHLAPQDAATLYQLIRTRYRGAVPRLAYDDETRTASNRGDFMHDARGHLKMTDGYRVLVLVEDYGGDDVVAALY